MRSMRQGVVFLLVCGGLIFGLPHTQVQAQYAGVNGPRNVPMSQEIPAFSAAMDDTGDPEPEPVTAPVEINDDDLVAPPSQTSAVIVSAPSAPVTPPSSVLVDTGAPGWLMSVWQHPVLSAIFVPAVLLFLAIVAGALVAAFAGVVMVGHWRRADRKQRQQAAAAVLATELETRRQAFDVVPIPPGAEAGMSFVSSVMALSRMEQGYHAAMGNLYLLPPRLAASVTVHYAAVQRTAAFTHSQSLAAGLRMLQANRIGGNPCPDANTMRSIHQELETAFQGIDKIIQSLKAIAGI